MDEVWHTLPLGMPRCHTGTHRHRVVFDCVALYNVLCRHAPPLRWRETAVVFILRWHTLPLYWLAHSAIVLCLACIANESCDSCRAGATTSPLIIILCCQHTAFLLFCVVWHALPTSRVTHAVWGLRQVLLLLFCVLNTPLFIILLCLARIANESCDSCRAGATTSPLIIILCSQHTTFLLFCVVWHALPTSRVTHAVRGLRQVLLLLFCVLNTPLFIILLCLARIANESCDSCRAGATTSPLIIILCLQHTTFLLFPPFLLARNVTVRGSRYSCCLGHRLLFPYMILFKLYIC